jgi:hypothetical protein
MGPKADSIGLGLVKEIVARPRRSGFGIARRVGRGSESLVRLPAGRADLHSDATAAELDDRARRMDRSARVPQISHVAADFE